MSLKSMLGTLLVVVMGGGLAACGGGGSSDAKDSKAQGELTIYSSFPLQGAAKDQSTSIVKAIQLAFDQAGGRAGDFKVRLKSLDDSTAQAATWDPAQVSSNARTAAGDKQAIGYIGEYNSGATALSLPILNGAGMPQLGVNTAVGLTTKGPGSVPGEPEKYYPSGKRTFVRVLPKDSVQGGVLANLMKSRGCQNVFIINDQEVYGQGLAKAIEEAATKAGLKVLANQSYAKDQPNFRGLAAAINRAGAACIAYSGITANNAVQVVKDVAIGNPDAQLFATDGVAEAPFYDSTQGGLPASIAKRVSLTVGVLPPDQYPPAGKKFFADYQKKYGSEPAAYAVYAYESAELLLDAIKRAGAQGNQREAVLKQLFATKDRDSVLGTYSITSTGDTTLDVYSINKIKDNQLVFEAKGSAS